jgi:hypothetical protein
MRGGTGHFEKRNDAVSQYENLKRREEMKMIWAKGEMSVAHVAASSVPHVSVVSVAFVTSCPPCYLSFHVRCCVVYSVPGEVIFLHIKQFGGKSGASDVHQILLELHIISTVEGKRAEERRAEQRRGEKGAE